MSGLVAFKILEGNLIGNLFFSHIDILTFLSLPFRSIVGAQSLHLTHVGLCKPFDVARASTLHFLVVTCVSDHVFPRLL